MVENWLNGGILTEWLNHLNVVVFKLIKFVVIYVVLGRGLSYKPLRWLALRGLRINFAFA